jgi:hypothetical protein
MNNHPMIRKMLGDGVHPWYYMDTLATWIHQAYEDQATTLRRGDGRFGPAKEKPRVPPARGFLFPGEVNANGRAQAARWRAP